MLQDTNKGIVPLVMIIVLLILGVSLGVVGGDPATTDFKLSGEIASSSATGETISLNYTIENRGKDSLDSLGLQITNVSENLTITDIESDNATSVSRERRAAFFPSVSSGQRVNLTITADVADDADSSQSLTVAAANGFDENKTTERQTTTIPVKRTVADAGNDKRVIEGSIVTLDGTSSLSSSGESLSYSWKQITGESVDISNSTTAVPEFKAISVSTETTLVFELTVTGPNNAKDSDIVKVTIHPGNSASFTLTNDTQSTVSPGESSDITYTIENRGKDSLDSLGLQITNVSENLTITDIESDNATSVSRERRAAFFPSVSSGQRVNLTITADVADDADSSQSLTVAAANGFDENKTTERQTTTIPVQDSVPPNLIIQNPGNGTNFSPGTSSVILNATYSEKVNRSTVRVFVDGVNVTDNASITRDYLTLNITGLRNDTTHSIRVVVTDNAGNRQTTRSTFGIGGVTEQLLTAERTIHGSVRPGGTVAVTIRVRTSEAVDAPAIDEDVPDSLSIVSQTTTPSATYRPSENQWLWLQAAADTTLTVNYTMEVPETATIGDTFSIGGTVSSSDQSPIDIGGETTIEVGSCINRGVAGANGVISLPEIQTAINWWAEDTEVPNTGGQTISLPKIQSLINAWAEDQSVGCGG
jgi:hypothetical protein